MSAIDVSDLAREELAAAPFPADYHAPFRLFLAPEVHRGVQAHAKEDTSVEICGVLVGQWGKDEFGPFAAVTDFIRCDNASSKFAEVTFTHESWAQINQQMDSKFADKRIIGWYHSHPDFGIFLSDRDCFIHEHFFSGPGQVAYVVDPVRDLEGVFDWQAGKPTPMGHYWVGSDIYTVAASKRNPQREGGARMPGAPASAALLDAADGTRPTAPPSSLASMTTMLGWLALFLLGYLLAGARTRWEQERLVEGAVAHYGLVKVKAEGLDQRLDKVRKNLRAISAEAKKLPPPTAELTPEEAEAAQKQRQQIADNLMLTERMLEQIQDRYVMTPAERAAYVELFMIKQAEAAAAVAPTQAASPPAAPHQSTPQPQQPPNDPQSQGESSAVETPAEPSAE